MKRYSNDKYYYWLDEFENPDAVKPVQEKVNKFHWSHLLIR
jgi:hypothetical protein